MPKDYDEILIYKRSLCRSRGGLSLFLPVLALMMFSPALNGGFIWDDAQYVTENELLRAPDGLSRIWLDLSATRQYYPLSLTLFWIEYQLWGLDPFGYHLVNVILHGINAVLAGAFLDRLGAPFPYLSATLFAIHPVQVESVAWIMETKNVLSGICLMAASLTYFRFEDPHKAGGGKSQRKWGWYFLSLGLFMASLLSKSVTCVFPLAALGILWWKRGTLSLRDIIPLVPFFLLGTCLGLLTVWSEVHRVGAQGTVFSAGWMERFLVAGWAAWFYVGKLVWPHPISFIYPRWEVDTSQVVWWLGVAGVLLVVGAFWLLQSRIGRGSSTACLLFLIFLFPSLGFFNVFPMQYAQVADRYQYLACLPMIVLILGAIGHLGQRLVQWDPMVVKLSQSALIVAMGSITWNQSHSFQSMEVLWRDTLLKNPGAWVASNNLGNILLEEGRIEEAVEEFSAAAALKPDSARIQNNLGYALGLLGRTKKALEALRRALELDPGYAKAHLNLARLAERAGQKEAAGQSYETALSFDPTLEAAREGLARVRSQKESP